MHDCHALVLVLLSPPAAELPAAALSSVAATASASMAKISFKLGLQVHPLNMEQSNTTPIAGNRRDGRRRHVMVRTGGGRVEARSAARSSSAAAADGGAGGRGRVAARGAGSGCCAAAANRSRGCKAAEELTFPSTATRCSLDAHQVISSGCARSM